MMSFINLLRSRFFGEKRSVPLSQPAGIKAGTFTLILCLVVVLRLFLTGDRDIVALNSPYDEYWFVHSAARMIWGGNYNQLAFAHLPIYSIWLAGLNVLGIPARLGIDLAWILATGYGGFALFKLTARKWVGALFWLFCIFHPLFLVLFDRALSETLLSVLLALLAASGLEIWNTRNTQTSRRGRIAGWGFAIALGLAFHVRKEGVLLLAPLAVLAIYAWAGRKTWWQAPIGHSLGGRLLVLPLLAIIAIGVTLTGMNYLRWGLAVRYELAAPGYERAMSALNRIDSGRGPLYVTVTSKSRQLAYENSPTFRELRDFFEGETGKSLAAHTAQFTGQQGEIGNGWFYWALRDAGAVAGWHSNARHAEQKYAAIADELEDAFRNGRLKSYSSFLPAFLDPDLDKWINRVPSSSIAVLALLLETRPASVQATTENATPKQFAEFVEIVGRRNPQPTVAIRGWIIVPEGSLLGLTQTGREPSNWIKAVGPARPDVPGGLPFSLAAAGTELPDQMLVKLPDGKTGSVGINDLREGTMAKTGGNVSAVLGIDELSTGVRSTRIERWLSYLTKKPVRLDWMEKLGELYSWLNMGFVGLLLLLIVKILLARQWHSPLLAILLVGGAMILSRALLFGVLDASAWNGAQARYMAPFVPIFACLAVLAAWSVRHDRTTSGRENELM